MSDSSSHSVESDDLMREAIERIVRLTSGAATVADARALLEWRGQSREHDEAFSKAAQLWKSLEAAAIASGTFQEPRTARFSRRTMISGALAASAAGFLLVRPPYRLWPSLGERVANLDADLRTETGKQRDVKLSDGVSLRMNTRTSVALNKTAAQLELRLISGEAFVVVDTPSYGDVVVTAAHGSTRVGKDAQVNVRRDDDRVFVTCVGGRVVVECAERKADMKASEQVFYDKDGLSQVSAADLDVVTAWRDGRLVFRERPLSDVIDEVNRYRARPIILANSTIAGRRVSGTFHLDHLDDVVAQIEKAYGAKVTALPGGVVLLS